MRHLIFQEADSYRIALLIKPFAFNQRDMEANYVHPLNQLMVPSQWMIGFTLDYDQAGKAPVKFIKEYLSHLLPALQNCGVEYLYVADGNYFKVLTGEKKAEPHYGYVLPCKVKGFEHMKVVLGLNYQQLIYNPDLQPKLDMTLKALADHIQGNYQALGEGIIHSAEYPETVPDIAEMLQKLHQYPTLTCDTETASLRFTEAGLGTIEFAWDMHNGTAFACDYAAFPEPQWDDPEKKTTGLFGQLERNFKVRQLLREFFETYQGTIIYHNATFDLKILIYALFMKHPLDQKGLLEGLHIMTRDFHCTKIIAYLATNSTAGNELSLKSLAHEFAGNWAQSEIKNIFRIPLPQLREYNLVDGLCTHFVFEKYYPIMVQDNQLEIYETLMKPSIKTIVQIELSGMPMQAEKIAEARAELERTRDEHLTTIMNQPVVRRYERQLQHDTMVAANAKLKTKQHPIEHFSGVKFNPGSGQQLQGLLYETMGLPVLDYTATRQPATGADVIEKLIHHTDEPEYKALLEALIGLGKVSKILSAFIPAFERGIRKSDGLVYLHGSFNLGGTVSGRLSSSEPNMQNLPAGSTYGKLIKKCFSAPKGWLFVGADFASLEDRINTLLTKDPNKLKVYTDGYDGHSLRAFAYFPERLPGIVDTVESINSISKLFPDVRQDSKSPTFALTYQGTWMTLVKNLGFPKPVAMQIEDNYHKLYVVSDQWVQEKIDQAAKVGYSEAAFGLRIRTPLLHQTLRGLSNTPREAEAEARTLGNAISGQSYGLLNNRAVNAFMEKVWASKYRYDVKPVALIHDAIYLLIRDDVEVVEWVNRELALEMSWQELPEIAHDQVHLGAELDIFWPSWANAITLPNGASQEEIIQLCKAAQAEQK